MLRFLTFLLGREYETCKSCETLKQQLNIANHEKEQLQDTLISLLKPKVYEAAPIEIPSAQPTAGLWSRRKRMLEDQDRNRAKILRESPLVGQPDNIKLVNRTVEQTANIAKLEEETGIIQAVEDEAVGEQK